MKLCRDAYPFLGWPIPDELYELDNRCCWNCHEDYEEYGYDLMWIDLPDHTEAFVCCGVANAWHQSLRTRTSSP